MHSLMFRCLTEAMSMLSTMHGVSVVLEQKRHSLTSPGGLCFLNRVSGENTCPFIKSCHNMLTRLTSLMVVP